MMALLLVCDFVLGLKGVTNSVHCFDVLTKKWTR